MSAGVPPAARVPEAAVRHGMRGRFVFPCRGKQPLTENGLLDATTDSARIEGWWRRWPEAGVAIRTGRESNLVVLDVDGDDGAESLRRLECERDELPRTASVKTPSGGEHFYFRHPGGEIRNSAGKLGPGLDVRGDGGYVVAPPTPGYEPDEEAPIAELPEWLRELMRAVPRQASPASEAIPAGERNATLASLAGSMRRRAMDADAIAAALKVENAKRCRPPLPEAEVEHIAASIARYEPAAKQEQPARSFEVKWTDEKVPKLVLPDVPQPDDLAGLAAWLTCVLRLDPAHPVTTAQHQGVRGQEGHVVIRRADAPPLRFEPAATISMARRLLPALGWQLLPSDGEPYGFKDEHARRIAYVVNRLCGNSATASESQETAGIVGMFMLDAEEVEGFTTYGTGAQRYEAAAALQRATDQHTGRPSGRARYLRDSNTGEVVIRASDLRAAARSYLGSSLARGWLDARMDDLGWQRVRLDGHASAGRGGRHGPHARADVYRGHLPSADDEAVNT
jgi:Bifunctional DNA primase/polymerase, N-terminal/Primase C terminal 1 (PriCT-1)